MADSIFDDGRTHFVQQAAFRRLVLRLIRGTPYGEPFNDYMNFFATYKDPIIDMMIFQDIHQPQPDDPEPGNSFKAVFFLIARLLKYNEVGEIIKSEDVWFTSDSHNYK